MPKLINVDKLEEYKADCCVSLTEWQEGWNDAIDMIMSEAPIVDVEPVRHGHWVRNDNGTYSCSECQSWIPNEQHYYARYCLHCGAKMDGGENETNAEY